MNISPVVTFLMDVLLPLLAWAALAAIIVRWYFRRWETRLAAERSFKLRFPLSSMVFLSRRIVIEELLNDPELQAATLRTNEKPGFTTLAGHSARSVAITRIVKPGFRFLVSPRMLFESMTGQVS